MSDIHGLEFQVHVLSYVLTRAIDGPPCHILGYACPSDNEAFCSSVPTIDCWKRYAKIMSTVGVSDG